MQLLEDEPLFLKQVSRDHVNGVRQCRFWGAIWDEPLGDSGKDNAEAEDTSFLQR